MSLAERRVGKITTAKLKNKKKSIEKTNFLTADQDYLGYTLS